MGLLAYCRQLGGEFLRDWTKDTVSQLGIATVIAAATLFLQERLGLIAPAATRGAFEAAFLPLLVAAAVLVLFHVFRAQWSIYRQMHRKLTQEIQTLHDGLTAKDGQIGDLEKRLNPSFLVRVQNFSVGPAQEGFSRPHDAIAHIELVVTNNGAPSIAADWTCEVTYEGKRFQGRYYAIPEGWTRTLVDEAGNPQVKFSRAHFVIFGKHNTSAIPRGERVIGWVAVLFSGISKDQLFDKASVWLIS